MWIARTPVQAPNANAYAERFVRSIRAECLDRLVLFGERRLLRVLHEFVTHYYGERNDQGLGNELITPAAASAGGTTPPIVSPVVPPGCAAGGAVPLGRVRRAPWIRSSISR